MKNHPLRAVVETLLLVIALAVPALPAAAAIVDTCDTANGFFLFPGEHSVAAVSSATGVVGISKTGAGDAFTRWSVAPMKKIPLDEKHRWLSIAFRNFSAQGTEAVVHAEFFDGNRRRGTASLGSVRGGPGALVVDLVDLASREASGATSFWLFIRHSSDPNGIIRIDEIRIASERPDGVAAERPDRTTAPQPVRHSGRDPECFYLVPCDTVLVLGDATALDGRFLDQVVREAESRYEELTGPGRVRIVKAASPGATVDVICRTLKSVIARERPTVALVCVGMSDSIGGRLDRFERDARAILSRLESEGIATTVVTPPSPCTRGRPDLVEYDRALERASVSLRAIAGDGIRVADCYAALHGGAADGVDHTWGDGVHPNELGHRAMAKALAAAWGMGKPIVRKDK